MQENRGVFTTDRALEVRAWNAWMEQATGLSAGEVRGRPLTYIVPNLESRGLLKKFQHVLDSGVVEVLAPAFHHFLIPCPSPSPHFDHMQQLVTIAPLKEGDKVVGTIVSIEDVTPEFAGKLDDLGHRDWRKRQDAAKWVATHGDESTVTVLIDAIRKEHRDASILNSAVHVLSQTGWDTLPALSALSKDSDPEVRMYAVLTLGERNDRRGTAPLIDALEDESVNVRYHAIEALSRLRPAEAVEPLTRIALSGDFFLAFPAIDALTVIGDTRVIPALLPLLKDESLTAAVTEAVGRLGDAEHVPALLELLDREHTPIEGVVQAIAGLHERYETLFGEGGYIADVVRQHITGSAVQRLLAELDKLPESRIGMVVKVLGWIEGEDVRQALAKMLGMPSVRKEVVVSLVRYGSRVTPLLVEQLRHGDSETRQAAILALGRIGDAESVPALVQTLETDHSLAVPAATALARIGDRRAFEALLELIGHPNINVRRSVVGAINSLGHPDMAERGIALLRHSNPLIRESAVRIVGYFGYSNGIDALLECCADRDEGVRRAVVEHLPYLDDARAIQCLSSALRDGTSTVRATAAQALGHVDDPDAMKLLLDALRDADSWVRYYAARSLGSLRNADAVTHLKGIVQKDPADPVRIAATEAIGAIGGPEATSLLQGLVHDKNFDLARCASIALASLDQPESLAPLFELLRSHEPRRKSYAVDALGFSRSRKAVDTLEWLAATESEMTLVLAAIEKLAQMKTKEAATALIRLTADRRLRDKCVMSLSESGGSPILEALEAGLRHPQPVVREAVIDALSRIKTPEASAVLVGALDDADASVRLSAVTAFGRLGSFRPEKKLLDLVHKDPDPVVQSTARQVLERMQQA